jgi:hypothetical protein
MVKNKLLRSGMINWNDVLLAMGCERCSYEPCLYKYTRGNDFLYVTFHVDDGLIVASGRNVIDDFMVSFLTYIRSATRFDPLEKYLGIEIKQIGKVIFLTQKQYIKDMNLYDESSIKRTLIPMNQSENLRIEPQNPNNESLLPVTGKYRYITDRTRPDLLVSVGEISSNATPNPSDRHVAVAKQIFKYLKNTVDVSLQMGGSSKIQELFAFSDASYVTHGNCKSRLGGAVFYGYDSGAIEKFSLNDSTVSHSSTETEIKALDLTAKTIVHCLNLLQYLFEKDLDPTTIYVDNKSAIALVNTLRSTTNTRHLGMRIEYIRECINRRIIQIAFIPTELNVTDILTKPLNAKSFIESV